MTTVFENSAHLDEQVDEILSRMTMAEKIGQMTQLNYAADDLHQAIRDGRVGSVVNEVDVTTINRLQKLAMEESRLGIPLLMGRDVIHGFKTIFPIPLGLAASWNPEVVLQASRTAAIEASSNGINWTFSPMVDITRDPRWGRIAECLGEDPHLCTVMAAAMVEGYQGEDLSAADSIAACAKHFAGYGASEAGRDYNTVNLPEIELRNTYLPPFKAVAETGVATFMSSFSELNGIPATGNEFLLKQVLRQEWGFNGPVISDWESIPQMAIHGFCEDEEAAALAAFNAGVDMEMASCSYADQLSPLLGKGMVSENQIDTAVARILRLKFRLGLFDRPYTRPSNFSAAAISGHLDAARHACQQSCVLLKNNEQCLPLSMERLDSIAVIGPLADEPQEQLGTWVFDGDPGLSQTCLQAIRSMASGNTAVRYSQGLENSRSKSHEGFADAVEAAMASDLVILFAGEEAILSGEAHCRANIDLPGQQQVLVEALSATGKPLVMVIMAGRPLTLGAAIEKADAVLYAWHPGSMGGPAIADLLFGNAVPSGKLPVTFPRMVGQIPIYHAQKNTGKPASAENYLHIDDIAPGAEQTSFGMSSMHLDAGFTPLFPFGFGLSYTTFEYANIRTDVDRVILGDSLEIAAEVKNTGKFTAEEVVQLYIRDLVGSVTRPVRELKGFKKIRLEPGQTKTVRFELHTDELAFYGPDMRLATEPGKFDAWIGGSSDTNLRTGFTINQ